MTAAFEENQTKNEQVQGIQQSVSYPQICALFNPCLHGNHREVISLEIRPDQAVLPQNLCALI
jgi:hypothetical protein